MIAKHVLNIHRTAGNAPERDDTDKKVLARPVFIQKRRAVVQGWMDNSTDS